MLPPERQKISAHIITTIEKMLQANGGEKATKGNSFSELNLHTHAAALDLLASIEIGVFFFEYGLKRNVWLLDYGVSISTSLHFHDLQYASF